MLCIKKTKLYFLLKSWFYRVFVRGLRKRDPLFKGNFMGVSDSAISLRYSYTVFMRHIVHLFESGMREMPRRVAEFGPGSSLGIGICALLSGAEEYYAFDAVAFAENTRNIKALDEIAALFREKTPIPSDIDFPEVRPLLNNYSFPTHIFSDDAMRENLSDKRLNSIRRALTTDVGETTGITIKYIVPWESYAGTYPCVDLILSQAVLEHIDDLKRFYRISRDILTDGGFASHDIDFRSHCETYEWNGHWAIPDKKWNTIRGARPYMINREPLSTHLRLLEENGFQIALSRPCHGSTYGKPSILRKKLAGAFANLSDDDFGVATCYVIARKVR